MKRMRSKTVLFIVDGCRADYLDNIRTRTIAKMVQEGTLVEDCRTVFPSMTHPAHTSIVTGLYPSNHGMLSHHYYDKRCRRFGDFLTYNKFRGKSIAELVKFAGGTVVSVDEFTSLGRGADLYVNIPTHDIQEVTHHAIDAISRKIPDLLIVTYFFSDDVGTGSGPRSKELAACIRDIDGSIEMIVKKAQETCRDKRLLFVLSSDHGMVDTGTSCLPELKLAIEKTEINHILLSEGLYAQLYFDRNDDRISLELPGFRGLDVIMEKDELKALNCFDELIGDVVIACQEGFNLIEQRDGIALGLHGSLVDGCMRVPLVFWGSTVKTRRIPFAEVVDVAPTIAGFMGLEYHGLDGRALIEAFDEIGEARFCEISEKANNLRSTYHQRIGLIRQMSDLKKARPEGTARRDEFVLEIERLRESLKTSVSNYEGTKQSLK